MRLTDGDHGDDEADEEDDEDGHEDEELALERLLHREHEDGELGEGHRRLHQEGIELRHEAEGEEEPHKGLDTIPTRRPGQVDLRRRAKGVEGVRGREGV